MRDLREFHDPHLHLPINGKTYTIQSPTAEFGLRIRKHMVDPGRDTQEELRIRAKMLGATFNEDTGEISGGLWDEMNADGVPLIEIMHCGNTALAHFGVSPEFGELWWETKLGKEHLPLVPEAAEQWERSKINRQVGDLLRESQKNS